MLATKPVDLTLAIQKATEGFTIILGRPTDNDLIEIQQILVPVLMKTTYNELILKQNVSGVILPAERYERIYKNGAYVIPPVIPLYDENIDKDSTRVEINRAEGKNEARQNGRQLYKTSNNACCSFIMAVVEETWYKELEYPDTFYTKVTAIKLLDHLT